MIIGQNIHMTRRDKAELDQAIADMETKGWTLKRRDVISVFGRTSHEAIMWKAKDAQN